MSNTDKDNIVYKPEHYADFTIKAIETRHLAEKDDFFGVARYRNELIQEFTKAISQAYHAGKRKGRVELETEMMEEIDK